MPPAKTKAASGLSINLSPEPTRYNPITPSSRLSGSVHLASTDQVSIGSITLNFYGRAKVRINQHEGEHESVYRSRANFFYLTQELFRSEYTFKGGEYTWPFEIIVPNRIEIESQTKGKNLSSEKNTSKFRAKDRFLTTEVDAVGSGDIVEAEFPPSMRYYHGIPLFRQTRGFVEYVLEVVLQEAESKRMMGLPPKKRTTTVVLPLEPHRLSIVQDYQMQEQTRQILVKSSSLTSGSDTTTSSPVGSPISRVSSSGSSIRTLFRSLSLSSTKVPIDITISHPTVLQVHHADPIPFTISVSPNTSFSSCGSIPSLSINIKTFSFHLICQTYVRAVRKFSDLNDAKTVAIKLADNFAVNKTLSLTPDTSLTSITNTISNTSSPKNNTSPSDSKSTLPASDQAMSFATDFRAPFSPILSTPPTTPPPFSSTSSSLFPSSSATTNNTTLNLGTISNLCITSAKLGRVHEPILIPTFKTYNIGRVFGLKYVVELEIVDEGSGKVVQKEKVKGEVGKGGVVVVGIAECIRRKLAKEGGELGEGEVEGEEVEGEEVDGDEVDEQGEEGDESDEQVPRYEDVTGERDGDDDGVDSGRTAIRENENGKNGNGSGKVKWKMKRLSTEKSHFREPMDENRHEDRGGDATLPRYQV